MGVLDLYIPIVEFLGQALGKRCEIVLHDLTTPDQSIIAIANGHISGRKVGGPITDLVLKVLQQGKNKRVPSVVNYQGKGKNDVVCRSSSFFISDEQDKVIGVLCINMDITPYIQARNFLEEEVLGELGPNAAVQAGQHDPTRIFENFQQSIEEVINAMIETQLAKYPVNPDRLSLDERLSVVSDLNSDGLFLLKGGITTLAERLDLSEPTIYRYLSKVKKENSEQP